jgi:hypothetical protein
MVPRIDPRLALCRCAFETAVIVHAEGLQTTFGEPHSLHFLLLVRSCDTHRLASFRKSKSSRRTRFIGSLLLIHRSARNVQDAHENSSGSLPIGPAKLEFARLA